MLLTSEFVKQTVPDGLYEGKIVDEGTGEFAVYDFATGAKTDAVETKYWVDLEIDGVEDINRPGQCFRKRLFFKISTHEKANLPKFLRAVRIPIEANGSFDTGPAMGSWVSLDIVRKVTADGSRNTINAYVPSSRKRKENPIPISEESWDGDGDATLEAEASL